ncbi:CoA-acylating methylmalonate-semialdehyde dehydrogenase [Aliifodinibius sp. S!AR15-10]|uniref:CoA-acylating methylmalonate-semialdehyde dehydrogenase n=1 Tax=Aliifodinibius sp. S!AR15-10 TaxID=2950437 RepID=UPI00285DB7B0|nr:CoA-acylating methylmalonate-semialdehyde dehydrogenase [Aliifodinibius sp. S!AR15-10]MDR8391070.1 CoA-acylating methylmalonate-semialdehyde dehydrogenase [Aliifodinibius sp. S!AR15-10]
MSLSIESSLVTPLLTGGKWITPKTTDFEEVYNPSSAQIIAYTPICGAKEVEEAVEAARTAFKHWSQMPPSKRSDILFRYRKLLKENFDDLSRLITRENGKTLEEAKGDIQRGLEVVEFACGIAELSKGETLPQIARQIDSVTMREPLGVCVGISPFNFPAMVPMWMFPIAIACGNTFILKPSEKVPLTAIRLAELFQEAGLPDGVLNIVHGSKNVVEALCTHPDVSAISFVGSSKIAKQVYALGCRYGKRVQAGGGAKNALIVMPDADPESTLRAIMGAAFGCAGQRCMAGSLLMGIDEIGDKLQDRLVDLMNDLNITDTSSDDTAEMGPVIDKSSQMRINKTIGNMVAQDIKLVRDGRENVPEQGFFVGPTLFDQITPKDSAFSNEIFGPVLSMLRPKNIDQAIEWQNSLPYGNGATIFTNSGATARRFSREINCGMVGVNVGVPAPMAMYPFSGWNDSFYGDLHLQGAEGVMFYTRQKIVLSRWDDSYERHLGW